MTVVIFILVLVALILVHEFGHFVAAKAFGMRVEEFGIGYPPKLWGTQVGETEYTLNLLPFGGFVKIFGEDPEEGREPAPRSFTSKPRVQQALVLLAGIVMNLLFAYILISATLAMGTPRALSEEELATAPDAVLMVAGVLPDSPAADSGLASGDTIVRIEGPGGSYEGADPALFTAFVQEHEAGTPLAVTLLDQAGEERQAIVAPESGFLPGDPERTALGVQLAPVGTVEVAWYEAPVEGALITWEVTKSTAIALVGFFASVFTLSADLSQVSGPVGIAGAVGVASENGLAPLMTITALISINLALINVLPIPALDGGRLLFVLVEALVRRPIKPAFANALNGIGFIFLILLMLVVTGSDILKLIG
ncbi:MAG TPA: site-2 protease family protein [Candidatus Paceibacterota bacterium]|nr:site-2 protease family protein [Candidatus Paceibacterota bacterium]